MTMEQALKQTDYDDLLAELLAGRLPDERGRFGPYGGRYVPETLVPALDQRGLGVSLTGHHAW